MRRRSIRGAAILAVLGAVLPASAGGQRAPQPHASQPASSHPQPVQPPPAQPPQPTSIAKKIEDILASHATASERVARLANLGPDAVPVLLAVLDAETVPFNSAETSTPLVDEGHEALIVAVLKRFSRGDLAQPIEKKLASGACVRRACLEVLGVAGDRRDLSLLCRLATPSSANDDLEPNVAPTLQRAASDILLRDFGAYLALQDLLRRQFSAVRLCLYRSLADTSSAQAMPVLVGRLGTDPLEDPILLSEIVRASRWVPLPPEIGVREGLRPYLHSDQAVLVQAAAACLGNLEDPDAVPELIEHLTSQDSFVRGNAHAALCRITSEKLLPDRDRWTAWYEAECRWYRERSDACIEDLRNEVGIRKNVALSEISRHALYREEFTVHVLRMLPHESEGLQRLGICALGLMGSTSSIPYLEATLSDSNPTLAAEAREALARIQERRPRPAKPATPPSLALAGN